MYRHMQFQIKDLKKLLYSLQEKQVNQINIKSQGFKLTINKLYRFNTNTNIKKTKNSPLLVKQTTNNNNSQQQDYLKNNKLSHCESETYSTVVSPMVGTFYSSPAPGEARFIELYDTVQQRQTVCIIEAMKLMNEIEAEVDGEIVEILVQDGDIVDCGQALMKVKQNI
uniref:Biotin carboxyl carrier protein of acetyl-CoA carboxylase n=1 Tax=Mastocarpus papillatus TaxID=31436 RepID=A0A342RZI7_9FLOR|nr:acetyl-CoA carboxylase biotin carboxyl carrier protein [Mastocarpus papillatus]AOL58133.1 acetyl-CoA carboxylase biotin carboxyl carrier protein [Mastocarpus papillatus]